MRMSEALLAGFDEEMENTRKLLAVVPDDKLDWQPHAKSWKLSRLAGHVAEMPEWASQTIQDTCRNLGIVNGKPAQTPYVATRNADTLEKFNGLASEARGLIAGASDEHLQQKWSLIFDGRTIFTMPRGEVLRVWFLNHMIHHRGQLSVYLRLLDVEIPGMYGPSADTGAKMLQQLMSRPPDAPLQDVPVAEAVPVGNAAR